MLDGEIAIRQTHTLWHAVCRDVWHAVCRDAEFRQTCMNIFHSPLLMEKEIRRLGEYMLLLKRV